MKKETLNNTENSNVYKRLFWRKLSNELGLCNYCPPHKGCNRRKKRSEEDRNWKNFRKTQWK